MTICYSKDNLSNTAYWTVRERIGVHEGEPWTRDAQFRNYIDERPPIATVRHESSALLRGHLCVQLTTFKLHCIVKV